MKSLTSSETISRWGCRRSNSSVGTAPSSLFFLRELLACANSTARYSFAFFAWMGPFSEPTASASARSTDEREQPQRKHQQTLYTVGPSLRTQAYAIQLRFMYANVQ